MHVGTKRLVPVAVSFLAIAPITGAAGCKNRELPPDMVASYTRSDNPAELRAELSIARGGIALTVVRLTASMEMGAFSTLFAGKGSATGVSGGTASASASAGRSVAVARTFRSLACDKTSCEFELAPDEGQEACEGSFERLESTLIVVATGPCKPYSGRWVLLEGARSEPAPSPSPSSSGPSSGPAKLDFPPDIPAPHDHMSCLQACSIVDTRCHRAIGGANREAFLGCVEKGQLCRARCEQVFPFFGAHD